MSIIRHRKYWTGKTPSWEELPLLTFNPLKLFTLFAILASLLGFHPNPAHAQSDQDRKAVLITGATSGIGLRMAQVMSQNGFFVYAGARKPEDMQRLNQMPNVKSVRLDVTIQSDIDDAVALVQSEGRGLYGLINNAGIAHIGPLIETPESDLNFLFDVNLLGPYRVTKAFADLIIESEGRIMNVTSIAGVISSPFSGVYSMSKHGLEAYTDSLAAEMERFNVRVAAVEPGNYKSKIVASMVKRMQASGYSAEGSRYGSMLDLVTGPLDRSQYKDPDDVAFAVLDFLTADKPKPRYMVVPTQAEAEMTIRRALQEAVQLNQEQAFSYSRDELVAMIDDVLQTEKEALVSEPKTGISLHGAAFTGDIAALQSALALGVDPDALDPSGATALIVATTFDKPDAVKALLAAGATVDKSNRDGSTPLHMAALLCREEILETLLEYGADKSLRSKSGATALELVTVPFEEIKPLYDFLGSMLAPYGLVLDYARIQAQRPVIAALLSKS
ncbi:SDR family NAD(P)-dependent oxidoreductase [Thalassovita sp.]|uniref:SDR family NAD(P)-dependent oxidoreductase n=1 Tax=Thalassovita sp. TaxID=1979401 RepID=UPI002B268355|nr:SDR family NAD(P)-dependent oxidoreductase [Thalassovita sp.]